MLNHIKNIPQNNLYLKTESFNQDPLILMHFKADILFLNLSIQIIICYLFCLLIYLLYSLLFPLINVGLHFVILFK
jgi:hypothetical protein